MYKLTQVKIKKLLEEVQFQYSRSSGPGGQKVNKTETQAEARWSFQASNVFREEHKTLLSEKLKNRINKDGEVVVQSDRFRTRPQNQKDCFNKMCRLIEEALTKPKPRKKTKPSRAAVEKRISEKKKQSEKKKNRQKW